MRIIEITLLAYWTLLFLSDAIRHYSHYSLSDWIIVVFSIAAPYLFVWFIKYKKKKNNTPAVKRKVTNNLPPAINNSNSTNKPSVEPEPVHSQPVNYVETNNAIYRIDRKPITDKEVPYLIQTGYEKSLQEEKKPSNPKFHRTDKEENLSFNFMMKYGHEVDILTDRCESLYRDSFITNDLSDKINILNEAAKAFEIAKKFCYSKGKGGTIYFQDMWEHLHNSTNPCFSYLDNIQIALEEAIFQKDIVIPNILTTISNNDGILQKNIYKLLPDIDKSTIQRTIKQLESNNVISRDKKGNSYMLHVLK